MKVSPEIFREYDIRGIVGQDLTSELAWHLGRAIGTLVAAQGARSLVVGIDARQSGPELKQRLIAGLNASGIGVTDIGVTPTPVGYWAIEHLRASGGVQITGSHNPPQYNGFKLTLLGRSWHGAEIGQLRGLIESEQYATGDGKTAEHPVIEAYIDDLARKLNRAHRPMKVVVDAGNGVGGLTALPLYGRLGYEVVPLFCDVDGRFPHHHPDPTEEKNLEALRHEVKRLGADVGLALDGDADRLGVIDRDGTIVWGDRVLILLARAVLAEQPGATILGEVKCSSTLYKDIALHGGRPLMWRTGHSLIKAKMKEEAVQLAGEMSGHIFFKHRYYGFDDAVYAGARLLEILSGTKQSIGELLADVPSMVATPEIRVDCAETIKFELVQRVLEAFQDRAAAEGFSVIDIDGVRVEWPDGWGLVRPSNTQPILVLRFEAATGERCEQIREMFTAEIERQRAEMA